MLENFKAWSLRSMNGKNQIHAASLCTVFAKSQECNEIRLPLSKRNPLASLQSSGAASERIFIQLPEFESISPHMSRGI